MSKAQYRKIRKASEDLDLDAMIDTYGVCWGLKLNQYHIVDIIETAWANYKRLEKHAPKDSEEFYAWITEKPFNINGQRATLWDYSLKAFNEKSSRIRDKYPDWHLPELSDDTYNRMVLFTHIKAKIGDWDD